MPQSRATLTAVRILSPAKEDSVYKWSETEGSLIPADKTRIIWQQNTGTKALQKPYGRNRLNMNFTCAFGALLKPLLKPGDSSTIFSITELQTVNL
jgi:hypothetical protein